MNKLNLVGLALVATILICVGLIYLAGCGNSEPKTEISEEVSVASAKFKANPDFRQDAATKLMSHLKVGMDMQEIDNLLGEPTKKSEQQDGVHYFYSVGYSQFLSIQFDSTGKVQKIVSSLNDK